MVGALRFCAGALNAGPGEKRDYPVTNWLLVGAIVEGAYKKPFTEAVKELVLAPGGVSNTNFAGRNHEDVTNMAVAYSTSGVRKTPPAPPMVAASGTLYSTASDLVAIADTVYFTKLLSDAALRELSTIHVASEEYARGGRVKTIPTEKATRTLAWEAGVSGGAKRCLPTTRAMAEPCSC